MLPVLRLISLLTIFLTGLCYLITESRAGDIDNTPKFTVAYVESQRPDIPDANLFTHLIYHAGQLNDRDDKVILPNPEKLAAMVDLKEENPNLKIILCVAGKEKGGGYSVMCADKRKRKSFVKSCKNIIKKYNLDGIDFDWEFPGVTKNGHTGSPEDAANYVLLVKDMRKALGPDKWISFYSNHSAAHMDFQAMMPYVDYVNVSGYNLSLRKSDRPLEHHSPLYPSKKYGKWCIAKSINKHVSKGVPLKKILIGIPFYGWGKKPFNRYVESNKIDKVIENANEDIRKCWDADAKVPYYVNDAGEVVLTYDDERSIQSKCDYIRQTGLAGAFVWHYDADFKDHRLAKALRKGLHPKNENTHPEK